MNSTKGGALTIRASFFCSLITTLADRIIRLFSRPEAIADNVFILQGAIINPFTLNDPLEILAPISFG